MIKETSIANIVHIMKVIFISINPVISQLAITCSKLTIETLEQKVKYISHLVLVFLLLNLSR